jgi:hypothetical protein
MKPKSKKRKITVQMWTPLIKKLNEDTAAACLNRDAYLDSVLSNEAAMLVSEAGGRRNSDVARSFVKRCFLELKNHQTVSFSLKEETTEEIQAACGEVNVWRDVFINRIAYLLVVKSSALEQQWDLVFREHLDAIFNEGWDTKALVLGPRLTAIREFICDDPFLCLRAALRNAYPDTNGELHMLPLGRPGGETAKERGLLGFSTYLEDSSVPGTPENEAHQKWAAELLDTL